MAFFFLASEDAIFSLQVLPSIIEGAHTLVFCGECVDSSEGTVESHNQNFLVKETQLLPEG